MRALVVVALAVGALALAWAGMAADAGMFIPHDGRLAVQPGEFTAGVFASRKKLVEVNGRQIAYVDMGQGEPIILLHGCPFSTYEWRYVLPALATRYRVIAPDLIGLGDTPVRLDDDYRLPQDVEMVRGLMDRLGLRSARFIGHDHGGAVVQLLMQRDPDRIRMAILTNVEAYDQWPSKPETPDVRLVVNPVTSPLLYEAIKLRAVQRDLFRIAVYKPSTLTDEMLDAFVKPLAGDGLRWQRTRRFFAWQLDPTHNRLTLDAVPAMRRFDRPVLIVWGEHDTNFGPDIARRLARDIPGVAGIRWMTASAHLPMLEEPATYSAVAMRFFQSGTATPDEQAALANARGH
ncbi:MAG TPA: alpha/beta hydrolase [Caulobacteraceae bacterium]|nr:alpha/beta hydrolase [Caulobacteraceae bacterium]